MTHTPDPHILWGHLMDALDSDDAARAVDLSDQLIDYASQGAADPDKAAHAARTVIALVSRFHDAQAGPDDILSVDRVLADAATTGLDPALIAEIAATIGLTHMIAGEPVPAQAQTIHRALDEHLPGLAEDFARMDYHLGALVAHICDTEPDYARRAMRVIMATAAQETEHQRAQVGAFMDHALQVAERVTATPDDLEPLALLHDMIASTDLAGPVMVTVAEHLGRWQVEALAHGKAPLNWDEIIYDLRMRSTNAGLEIGPAAHELCMRMIHMGIRQAQREAGTLTDAHASTANPFEGMTTDDKDHVLTATLAVLVTDKITTDYTAQGDPVT